MRTTNHQAWSERERQVLDLIARGRTNGEIAEALGISFATAKWHVSQLISKLGVSTREELADYWRREKSLKGRIGRFARAVLALPLLKVAAGGTAVAIASVGGAVAWTAVHGGAEPDGSMDVDTPDSPSAPAVMVTPVVTPNSGQLQAHSQSSRPPGCPTTASSPDRRNLAELMLCPALEYPEIAALDRGGCDLTGIVVPSLSLDQVDFRGCRLDGAVLDSATLNGSSFEGVSARGASLRTSMAGAVFKGADLSGADLSNAVLQRADFADVTLVGADLTNAITRGAFWKNTTCPDGTNSDANGGTCVGTLWIADYWPASGPGGWVPPLCSKNGMSLPRGVLCPRSSYPAFAGLGPGACAAPGRDLRGADLRWADLKGCDLSGSNLAGADLEGASLAGANLAGADLKGAKLFHTDAVGANLAEARLDRAVVSHTSFEGVNLKAASVVMTLLRPVYRDTTCPDGSNSDAPDGDGQTCNNNH